MGTGTKVRGWLMTGVSYLIPFVAAGGILIALSFMLGGYEVVAVNDIGVAKFVDQFSVLSLQDWAGLMFLIGAGMFGFLNVILAGFIAYAIADRPGLAPGFIAGWAAGEMGAGFLGAIVGGITGGLIALGVSRISVPSGLKGVMPVMIIPLVATLLNGALMLLVVGKPIAWIFTELTDWLNSLSGSNLILLGVLLGLMMAFDMGGPVNKVAYTFAITGLTAEAIASDSATALQVMATVMAAGMVPPLALALASAVRPKLFSHAERESGKTAWVLGASFITEGAIPFAAGDPFRVIPSIMAGSALTGGLVMLFGNELRAPHGGVWVFGLVEGWPSYLLAVAAGTVLAAALVILLKSRFRSVDEAAARGAGRRRTVRHRMIVQPTAGGTMSERKVVVASSVGLHARPATLFTQAAAATGLPVTIAKDGDEPVNAASILAVLGLGVSHGETVVLRAEGDGADAALDALGRLVVARPRRGRAGAVTDTLVGIAASSGLAAGPAVRHDGAAGVSVPAATSVADASQRVRDDLAARASRATSPEGKAVLEALVQFASDPELVGGAQTLVDGGMPPPEAVRVVAERFAGKLQSLGGYFAERAPDVVDIGERMAAALEGRAVAELPSPGYPHVLVARDLAPADTATLDATEVLAIVTEQGGPTSHTAILARGLGIPAVVAVRGARDATNGQELIVDGDLGEVHVAPDAALATALREREKRRRSRASTATGPGRTKDGTGVKLLVNVGTLADASAAAEVDAEGIGLFRTEFLFLGRRDEPSVDEQVEAYSQVFTRFVGRRIVVRTLDAGSDKPLPFLGLGDEENPALGVRGLRTAVGRPEVLERQLIALASASARTGAQPWVMAPMVATVAEAQWFAAQTRSAGLPTVGIMVEVPSAALRAHQLLNEVDFASIGTNDLAQYALAADRQQGELGALLDPWQPAVVDLVAAACVGADRVGRPIGVCGEAAADPALAAVLVGLGVSSLSMAPVAVAGVRALLADTDIATCRKAAEVMRESASAADARQAVWSVLQI